MKSVQIGGKVYEVDVCNTAVKYCDNRAGWACPDQLKIVVSDQSPQDMQGEVFIHEVIEIINSQFDLSLNHQTISTLGECMYQVFKQDIL